MFARTFALVTLTAMMAILLIPGAAAAEDECNLVKVNQIITLDYFISAEVGFQEFDNCSFFGEWGFVADNGDGTYDYQFNGVWFVLQA